MALKLVTPPESEPLILSDVEGQIQHTLPADQQGAVTGFIAAVRQKAEVALRRALITQTWDMVLDGFPSTTGRNQYAAVEIPLPPLQLVESVGYISADNVLTVLDPAAYVVDTDSTPGRILPAYGQTWPTTLDFPGCVRIRFKAGYGDDATAVPQCIRQWMLLNVANLYENRESETVTDGKLTVVDLSTLADSLLDPERWGVRV